MSGAGGGRAGLESVIFFTENLKFKKMFMGVGAEVDGRTDKQAQTNMPIQLFRSWGHNNE